jgi:hypothetical protein
MSIFKFNKLILKKESLINDFFFKTLKNKLLNTEFSVDQNGNVIKFQRNLMVRNDVTVKHGLYRRIQVRGDIKVTKVDESKIQLEINTYFYFQFFAIILGIGLPIFLLIILNLKYIITLMSVYVVICFFYYLISVNLGNAIVERIINESLRESYFQNIGVKKS